MATEQPDVFFWATGHEGGAAVPTADAATTRQAGAGRRAHVQGMPVRRWLATTPGRLRVASVVVVAALLLAGVVAGLATSARRDATGVVVDRATPELVAAESLFAALADADAAASSAYLKAGTESPELRRRYERDIDLAGRHLARLATAAGQAPTARRAVSTIARQLPTYTGFIEASRAEDRHADSVSSSYLRSASTVMREEILPQATVLYTHAAERLDDSYRSGTSTTEIVLVIGAGVLGFALLLAVQLFLFSRMHRIVNVGLASATAVLVVLVIGTLAVFGSQQSDLAGAQRHGSDAVQILSAARILTLRAQNDDDLALIERGTGEKYLADYQDVASRVGDARGRGGLLDDARAIAARSGSTAGIERLRAAYATLAAAHEAVRTADDEGDYEKALRLNDEKAPTLAALDRGLGIEIARAQVELDRRASDAGSGLDVLLLVIPVLTVGAVLLVLVGLQRRIGEYR
jgi:hypothetical protein